MLHFGAGIAAGIGALRFVALTTAGAAAGACAGSLRFAALTAKGPDSVRFAPAHAAAASPFDAAIGDGAGAGEGPRVWVRALSPPRPLHSRHRTSPPYCRHDRSTEERLDLGVDEAAPSERLAHTYLALISLRNRRPEQGRSARPDEQSALAITTLSRRRPMMRCPRLRMVPLSSRATLHESRSS